jgi:bacteriorhodopsin
MTCTHHRHPLTHSLFYPHRPFSLILSLSRAQCSIIFSNAKRLRREASTVAAFIFGESFIFFAMKAQGALSAVCVAQVGGSWTNTERTQYPGRYIYWLASTPPIVAMLGRLAGATPGLVSVAVFSDIVVMATGEWGTWVPWTAGWNGANDGGP